MLRFRSRRFAMLLILMLTLSMALQGLMTAALAEGLEGPALEPQGEVTVECTKTLTVTKEYIGEPAGEVQIKLEVENRYWHIYHWVYYWQELQSKTTSGLVATFTMSTDKDHFRITEVSVPTGYQVSYPDGQDIWIYNNNPSGALLIRNTSDTVDLKVIKTINHEQGDPHEGVEFKLMDLGMQAEDSEGTEFGSGVTDADGILVFQDLLRDHTYRLIETVPLGYVSNLAEDNMIDPSGEQSGMMEYRVVNEENGSIIIHKSFTGGYGDTHFVCFSLYRIEEQTEIGTSGNGAFRTQCARIEGSGDIVFEGLPFGTYRIVEKAMPKFYETDLSEENSVVVSLEGLTQEVTIVNSYVSPITLEKTVVPAVAEVGDEVTYLFKVKNIGDVNLFHVQLHDMDIPFDAYLESTDAPEALVYEGEFLEPGEIWETSTTHILTAEDMAGGSFTNTAKVTANTCYEVKVIEAPAMNAEDISAFCRQRCILVEASDDATVTLPTVVPTPTVTEIIVPNDADPAGSFIPPEPVPLSAPVILPAEPVLPIEEEVIPLGVPVLPKTAELPLELFYGLGGMVAALGAYLKRK